MPFRVMQRCDCFYIIERNAKLETAFADHLKVAYLDNSTTASSSSSDIPRDTASTMPVLLSIPKEYRSVQRDLAGLFFDPSDKVCLESLKISWKA